MELLAQGQQFGHGHAVGIGIEDVGADVGVQRVQRELRVRLDAVGSARRLAVFHGKAEFRPDRPDAGIEPDADTHLQRFIEVPGQRFDEAELVPVVDLDQRPLANGLLQDRTRLERPVEDDVLAPDAELAGLLVFKVRNHLGHPALVVKHLADGREVVRLVGPGKTGVLVAAGESRPQVAGLFTQVVLGEHEQRRAELLRQRSHGHAVNLEQGGRARAACVKIAISGSIQRVPPQFGADGRREVVVVHGVT
ncbi:hypothetical protein D9M68_737510 [compost metagenome]